MAAVEARLARLDELKSEDGPPEVAAWRERLVTGGPEALEALVRAHPHADRQRLRVLVHNLRKANDHPRAQRHLAHALRQLLTGHLE